MAKGAHSMVSILWGAYPLVCQSAQEIGGNKSQFKTLVIYFLLRKDTSQNPLFS